MAILNVKPGDVVFDDEAELIRLWRELDADARKELLERTVHNPLWGKAAIDSQGRLLVGEFH